MPRSRTLRLMLKVSLAAVITFGCWFWFRSPSLESRLEQRRQSGLPATSTEVNKYYRIPSGIPDTTDIWLREIARLREKKALWSRIPEFRNRLTGTIDTPEPGEQWPHLDACRGLVAEHGQEIRTIWTAADAGGRIRVPVDFSNGISPPVPILDELYQTGEVVLLDAIAAAHDNDGDRLFRDLQALLALSEIQREAPSGLFLFHRNRAHRRACEAICRLVPRVTLSESSLESLQSAVAAADFRDEWQHALNGECAMSLSKVDAIFIGRMFSRRNKLTVLDFFDQTRDALSGPFPAALEAQAAVEAGYRIGGRSDILWRPSQIGALALLSDYLGLVTLVAREEARKNASVVALAALRYRHHNGHFPVDMAELDDFLPDDAVGTGQRTDQWSDPFSGEPLRYHADLHRVLIYSVSDNAIDDGGAFGQPDQPRIEPDIGVRLPNGLDGPASAPAEPMSE